MTFNFDALAGQPSTTEALGREEGGIGLALESKGLAPCRRVLIGRPTEGKSVIFGALTGAS